MKKNLVLLALLLAALACAKSPFYNPNQAFNWLEEAQTPADEAAAFEKIWTAADSLGFSAFDANGDKVPVSAPDFTARLHSIELRVDGATYRHVLLDPENIFILMKE